MLKQIISIIAVLMGAMTAGAQTEVYLKGNIVPTSILLDNDGGGQVWQSVVTLDDTSVFLFSDKYVYFHCPAQDYRSDNIRINGGTYTVTFNLSTKQWSFSAPTDEYRISAFGSSVCNGQGATGNKGYAYLYGQQLQKRYQDGTSAAPFYTSGVSIGGNNTQNLLDRYDELTRNYSRYVIIGLSMGNEGIHESTNKQQTLNQFSTNMQRIITKVRQDGMVPVVMNNYTRGDFTLEDYSYIKQMNLQIHEWDVASVNTLGAIDDGTGKWASGYMQDNAHPTTSGHNEFFYAMTPSLFDALSSGKAQPVRNMSGRLTLAPGSLITFRGEATVHPFTISLRVKGGDAGPLFNFKMTAGNRQGKVDVDAEGHVVYTNPTGRKLTSTGVLADDEWHTVTLTHYYAQGRTLLYLDTEEVGEQRERISSIADVTIGDAAAQAARQLSELFFWRSALSPGEVAAHCDGRLLKSSLELYVPTADGQPLSNLAMSLNTVSFTQPDPTAVSTPAANRRTLRHDYTLSGQTATAGHRGIVIADSSQGPVKTLR